MNKERILELAAFVEGNQNPFNMQDHETCLIGHASKLWPASVDRWSSAGASKMLGLTGDASHGQCEKLFFPGDPADPSQALNQITRERAVSTLRAFAETGQINYWPTKSEMLVAEANKRGIPVINLKLDDSFKL